MGHYLSENRLMYSLPTQVLLRNIEYFEAGNWAVINPLDEGLFVECNNQNLIGLHQFFNHYTQCQNSVANTQIFAAQFTLDDVVSQLLDGLVIYLPKSKQHLEILINNAHSLVKENGIIMVVGENKAGIKSVGKYLEKVGHNTNKIDSAKHCAIFATSASKQAKPFNLSDYEVEHQHTINDVEIKLVSLPGVFGHKQLDPGTELLLQQYPTQTASQLKGNLYDFACGTGVISCYLGKIANKYKAKLSIYMTDVFALAIHCSEKSLMINGLNANVSAADGFTSKLTKFDHIISNPPFHEGIHNNYKITENFIKQAYSNNTRGGALTIVANKFLPYPNLLQQCYQHFDCIAETNKYRVYATHKTKK